MKHFHLISIAVLLTSCAFTGRIFNYVGAVSPEKASKYEEIKDYVLNGINGKVVSSSTLGLVGVQNDIRIPQEKNVTENQLLTPASNLKTFCDVKGGSFHRSALPDQFKGALNQKGGLETLISPSEQQLKFYDYANVSNVGAGEYTCKYENGSSWTAYVVFVGKKIDNALSNGVYISYAVDVLVNR